MAAETQVFLGAVVSASGAIGTIISRVLEHPGERYEEKVKKLQQDRWSEVSTELGDVLATVDESIEDTEGDSDAAGDGGDTPPLRGRYSLYIQNELNTEELDDLRDKLEAVDEPRELFQTCRKSRDQAFASFLVALLLGLVSLGAFMYSPLPDGSSVGTFFAGFGMPAVGYAAKNTYDSWRARQDIDELWENFDFL